MKPRQTAPVDSKLGVLDTYEAQEAELLAAEVRGRTWCFEQAVAELPFSDDVVLELHRVMFAPLFEWAGKPRTTAVGPGGVEQVACSQIRPELRKLSDDCAVWLAQLNEESTLEQYAHLVADVHHRFQQIHPFVDTNGRTGRVLDHFLLWACLGLRKQTAETSPIIAYVPAGDPDRRAYYAGLADADHYRPERLRVYYAERIRHALGHA